jgi:hypothetical protein
VKRKTFQRQLLVSIFISKIYRPCFLTHTTFKETKTVAENIKYCSLDTKFIDRNKILFEGVQRTLCYNQTTSQKSLVGTRNKTLLLNKVKIQDFNWVSDFEFQLLTYRLGIRRRLVFLSVFDSLILRKAFVYQLLSKL